MLPNEVDTFLAKVFDLDLSLDDVKAAMNSFFQSIKQVSRNEANAILRTV